eukprot:scaffold9021_cov35-Tisochrysis_lutea.AAC.5
MARSVRARPWRGAEDTTPRRVTGWREQEGLLQGTQAANAYAYHAVTKKPGDGPRQRLLASFCGGALHIQLMQRTLYLILACDGARLRSLRSPGLPAPGGHPANPEQPLSQRPRARLRNRAGACDSHRATRSVA